MRWKPAWYHTVAQKTDPQIERQWDRQPYKPPWTECLGK